MSKYIQVEFRSKQYSFLIPDTDLEDSVWNGLWKMIGDFYVGTWTGFLRSKPSCPNGKTTQRAFIELMVELNNEWLMWSGLDSDNSGTEHSEWKSLPVEKKRAIRKQIPATMANIIARGPDMFRSVRNDGAKLFLKAKSDVESGNIKDFRDSINKACK